MLPSLSMGERPGMGVGCSPPAPADGSPPSALSTQTAAPCTPTLDPSPIEGEGGASSSPANAGEVARRIAP